MRYQIDKTKYQTKHELEALLNIINSRWDRDAVLIKIALATGARAQEILNIELSDLDDHDHSVMIYGLKNSNNREIPLEKTLYNALRTLATNNPSGRPFDISYSRLKQIWSQYSKKPFKSLRHTFAINTYKSKKDIMLVKTALGHVGLNNTNVYAEYVYKDKLLKELLIRKRSG